jgi:endo-1,4-beta-xylanase
MKKNILTRRDFLKMAGVTSAGLALSACGVDVTKLPDPTATLFLPTATNTPTPEPTATVTPRPPETLRDFAEILGIKIGTYIDPQARFWENPSWLNVASREFNLAVNSIYWHVLLPKENEFDFGLPDAQVDFAVRNNMEVRGAALVFSTFVPDWLKKSSLSREQYITLLEQVISKTMTRYAGKIKTWVVVNEAGFIYNGWDFFEKHIGKDYVEIAFQIARKADPFANLIYNDGGNESMKGNKYKQTTQIIESLRKQKLIDGVGLQMHIEPVIDDSTKFIAKAGITSYVVSIDEFIETMKSYDLPVHITELDVDLRNINKSPSERFDIQAKLYRDIIDAILKSGVCKEITFWGFGDKYSWLEQTEFNGSANADPTLFDDDLKPKPAYFAVRDVLKKYAQS